MLVVVAGNLPQMCCSELDVAGRKQKRAKDGYLLDVVVGTPQQIVLRIISAERNDRETPGMSLGVILCLG
jgi:hypothetical protein